MNSQTAKTIRTWANLRSLDYKVCKGMYNKLNYEDKRAMLDEAQAYITAVRDGRIEPSKPELPEEV